MSCRYAWVGNTFEGRGHEVAMLFSIRTPGCRSLLKNTIICEPVTSDHYTVDVESKEIHTGSSSPEVRNRISASSLGPMSKLTP